MQPDTAYDNSHYCLHNLKVLLVWKALGQKLVMPRAIGVGPGSSILGNALVRLIRQKAAAADDAGADGSSGSHLLSTICRPRSMENALYRWSHSGIP